ncbi:ABC transporter permease [Saccharopolyspora gloriosae]|uniref:Phospholipid/cholesterol/gamma-HCH transport system permease protein n=1 Tax=Saccharopolyspora gloriosae TaxID=455344 RepID=A0A840NCF2_9PSEU|nr:MULTISPECIES: ABC transporter permease [Saccharopolyspora]MBB5069284.1 phospholipid/cholesterol/gamma-HCH transport system permease protein [Saccharopolyspora gloriosae]MCX2730488.1 ABC transporter permease [Saccharopolyspora sp. NFXS83]
MADLLVRAARRGAVRRTRGLIDLLVSFGVQATFYFRSIASVPFALVHYGRHVARLVAEISFGAASLFAGGGTIGVIFAMSFVASTQVGLEGYRGLDLIGLTPMSGLMSAMVNTRELAPLVASIALAAKVGTGFTAQLGAMRISDEIDALESMAVRSLPFLVSTRMAAAFISVVPLYLVGLFASYIATRVAVVTLQGQSGGTYDFYFQLLLTPSDIGFSLLKAVVFAMVVTLVHCFYGYYATGGPEGVGRAAGRALRTSIVAITFTDMVLTLLFWGLSPSLPALGVQ